ncbi:MAG TPA: TonB family protein [Gammaproteobacteria bacterium]|nr:TonB family protein [Gammaproteobacteria bacterium]
MEPAAAGVPPGVRGCPPPAQWQRPSWPPEARVASEQRPEVEVDLVIDSGGRIKSMQVVLSTHGEAFTRAARDALRSWTFDPQPGEVKCRVLLLFTPGVQ